MRVPTIKLQQLTIFSTLLTGGGISTMYYLIQKYHKLALEKLEGCALAMDSLGAPPLKIHNIHLHDRDNRIDQRTAQVKIPLTGSRTGGYLYTSSIRDPDTNRWSVKTAVLRLKEGETINLMNPPSIAKEFTE
ncbi:cytochrome c oxidase assembly factor 1 homolog isoform X4 [Syngnathoides biaculeatus]|uniref:cytochrome c oxidase assembly factor 1 homolog isoform X4 n=1 Tax=Syngnathoides biaculeatus TaxID=300417 RepID=UPI002ADD6AF6|nr:cytochrome c oxidase assembly factor 1 homolog isoform X4 [Syngnathoides biaculeatus]XP_061696409.1 cytochrome c oxidase assembly factor 1 homolog isoform X4 [Syngnathoides biaculeatus]